MSLEECELESEFRRTAVHEIAHAVVAQRWSPTITIVFVKNPNGGFSKLFQKEVLAATTARTPQSNFDLSSMGWAGALAEAIDDNPLHTFEQITNALSRKGTDANKAISPTDRKGIEAVSVEERHSTLSCAYEILRATEAERAAIVHHLMERYASERGSFERLEITWDVANGWRDAAGASVVWPRT
jgi:hypothetical protein